MLTLVSAPCHLCGLSSWCVAWRQHKCFYSLRAHQLFFWCEHWFFWRGFGQVDASLPFVLAIAYQISDPRMSVVWFPDLLSSLLNPWCQLMLPRGKLKLSILVSCSFLALVKCLYLSPFWLIIYHCVLSISLSRSLPPLSSSQRIRKTCCLMLGEWTRYWLLSSLCFFSQQQYAWFSNLYCYRSYI